MAKNIMKYLKGLKSTVLSHEMDHLEGILHIDIAEEVLLMTKEERKKWRQQHGYKIYYKTGDYDLLKREIKRNNYTINKNNP